MPPEKQALTVGRRLKIYQDKQPRSKRWVTLIWPVAYWKFIFKKMLQMQSCKLKARLQKITRNH